MDPDPRRRSEAPPHTTFPLNFAYQAQGRGRWLA